MFWKASMWQQDIYVKQQKLALKDRRYLVTYIACLQKSSWASILTNFTILLQYQYWPAWIKACRILRCIRATFPAAHPHCKDHARTIPCYGPHRVLCSVTAGAKQPSAVHSSTMHIYLLMAESTMALKEISANFSLRVVSHLLVGPQQLQQQ